MKDEFANRQAMFRTVTSLLDDPAHKAGWENKPPQIFTAKAAKLRLLVDGLAELIRGQTATITGFAARKEREQAELEDKGHEVGQALAAYFEDAGREDAAAAVDHSRSSWHKLRDEALLARARQVLASLRAELAANAAALAPYGLDAADADALAKEADDFEDITARPSGAISGRKALTQNFRPRFREATELLQGMDKLVLRFRATDAGRAFADAWQTARVIRDLGAGPADDGQPPVASGQ